jgi:hypothetical protein
LTSSDAHNFVGICFSGYLHMNVSSASFLSYDGFRYESALLNHIHQCSN